MNLDLLINTLKTDKKNTKILLEALLILDLIYKDKNTFYKNTQITKDYFLYYSNTYCGDVFLHRKEMLKNGVNSMKDLVINGEKDIRKSKNPEKWADVSKKFLEQEQKNLLKEYVLNIVKNLKEYPNIKNMLDLGCSAGILGLEIVKSHQNMKGVLFDFPLVTNTALDNIKEYSLESRVSILNGNIQNDDLGGPYDLIWCSNVFYFLDNKEEVIKKIYKALSPKGVLISAHVEIGERSKEYEDSFFYFLSLNLQGRKILKPMELSKTFEAIGFNKINSFTSSDFPMTETQIHIVRK